MNKATILLVDDNTTNLNVLLEYLTEPGFKLLVAPDGEHALKQVEHTRPDIILLDVVMPGIDGFETCRRLKQNETAKDIPVIFMTALTDTVDKVKGFHVGGVDYITKPFQVEEVLVRVETHLALRNLQKNLQEKNSRLRQEIAKHKRAEETLQEVQIQQKAILDNIPDIAWLKDKESKFIAVNESFARACGVKAEDLVDKTDLDIWPRNLAERYRADDRNVIESGKQRRIEEPLADIEGKMQWMETIKTPIFNYEGSIIGTTGIARDITKRKQAEEMLHQLEKAVETTRLGITITDTNGKIVYVNPAEATMHGYKVDELIGQDVAMFAPPELRKPLNLERMMNKKKFVRESVNIRKDGSRFPVHLISDILKNAEGTPIATVTTCEDITERKRNEEAVKKANDELKARVDELSTLNRITQTVATVIDRQTALEIAAETMTGLFNAQGTLMSLLNETQTEVTVVAHYVMKNAKQGSLIGFVFPVSEIPTPFITQIIDRGQSLVISQAQTNPLTKSVHAILRSRDVHGLMNIPLQARGKVIGIIIVSTNRVDRTFTAAEVKLAETIAGQIAGAIENARLFDEEHHQRQVAESLREVALVLNSSLDRKAVLAQILAQLGRVIQYDSAGIFLQDGHDLVLSDGVNLAETFIGNRIPVSHGNPTARVFRNKQSLVLADVRTEPYWKIWEQADPIQSWIGAPLLIGEKAIGVLTVDNFKIGAYHEEETQILQTFANQAAIAIQNAQLFDDAQHAREEAEEALRVADEARRAAEIANKAKGEFLANMSHEIRTPMNVVLGFTELLDRLITDPKQKSYLDSIKTGGKSLLILINDILDLSKIEAGKMEIHPEPVNLTVIFQEISQIFHTKIAEKELEYLAEVAPDIPESLLLDEVRLRQVLFNLIGNALKFTDQGYIKLTAKTTSACDDESCLELLITVADSGIGIPESQQELIFDAFRQQDGQTTRKYSGTGLGLTITRRLVEIMDGTIGLTSKVGKGSRFEILLRHVPVAVISAISPGEEQIGDQQITFESATVLFVDDIQQNRLLIKEYFRDTNLKVIEAENGQQAVRYAQQYKPDIILMDLRMPVMDGYEATKQLKEMKKLQGIPVIALTAAVMKQDRDKINEYRFDGYLRKPVNRAELWQELSRFLPHSIRDVYPEPSECVKPPEEVTPETLEHLPELIEKLENECMDLWDAARQSGSFDEIEAFGVHIQQLDKRYLLNILQEFGKNLLAQVRNFDVEQIDVTLDAYPKLIEKVRKGYNERK